VLTGVVTTLLAQGLADFEAAWSAAFLHGLAGAAAADRLGGFGVLAGDVAEAVPEAVRAVRLP
jgi:ADP-dependent NAD(P)H-hydrate dehydratase / NAD(P)H-hydrate epimerase